MTQLEDTCTGKINTNSKNAILNLYCLKCMNAIGTSNTCTFIKANDSA